MRIKRKGQGLPLNTIIIAIIVIVVLVVIILIFTGNILNFKNATNDCMAHGGLCQANTCSNNQRDLSSTYPCPTITGSNNVNPISQQFCCQGLP